MTRFSMFSALAISLLAACAVEPGPDEEYSEGIAGPGDELPPPPTDDDPSAVLLCTVQSDSFSYFNSYEHHTTTPTGCVSHQVDLNLNPSHPDFGGQWATATFPEFTGIATPQRLLDCHASKIRITRSERFSTSSSWIDYDPFTRNAVATVVNGVITSCKATYATNCGVTFNYDHQKFQVAPMPKGSINNPLNGAQVQHDLSKGVNGNCF